MRWLKHWIERWLVPDRRDAVALHPIALERVSTTIDAPALEASGGRPAGPSPLVRPRRAAPARPTSLGLALQGGGAYGAFTWGVLDRLLDQPQLRFPILTGASAGALNGALLVTGHAA